MNKLEIALLGAGFTSLIAGGVLYDLIRKMKRVTDNFQQVVNRMRGYFPKFENYIKNYVGER